MKREEIEELKGFAASMGLYDDKNPCKRAVILGKAIQELEQGPRSEWEQDREILNAYSNGANDVLDKIRAEINTMPCAITSMREIYVNRDKVIYILDKYRAEIEPQAESEYKE